MSAYGTFTTTLRDEKLLCAALAEMGFTFECHAEAQNLHGYVGDTRQQKANIIIRRHHTGIGASNDVGFLKTADGTYQAIISDYDRGAKFNDTWLGKLSQEYGVQRTLSVAKNKGYVLQTRKQVGEKVQLVFGAR